MQLYAVQITSAWLPLSLLGLFVGHYMSFLGNYVLL